MTEIRAAASFPPPHYAQSSGGSDAVVRQVIQPLVIDFGARRMRIMMPCAKLVKL